MSEALTIELPVRRPYHWPAFVEFLAKRAIAGVESIDAKGYARTLRVRREGAEYAGWMRLEPALVQSCLHLTVSPALLPVVDQVRARAACFVDAHCDPEQVLRALGHGNADQAGPSDHRDQPIRARHGGEPPSSVLPDLVHKQPGLRVPGAMDGFELAVRAILGQQITVRAARTLAGRFAAAFGEALDAPGLTALFPRAADVAVLRAEQIAALGVIAARACAIIDIARGLDAGNFQLEPGAPVETCVAGLCAVRGVGEWTAQYVAMRALGWRDAFPHGDVALRKALGGVSAREALSIAERWRPQRAYAAMYLWRSLAD